MKKNLIALIVATLFNQVLFAQNLVPNWSFEDTISCPTNTGQLDRAIGWSSYRVSPDYFNTCADVVTSVSVPINFSGSHYPHTGNAYAGFVIGLNAREYLGVSLTQPLNIGQKYYVIFFVCRGGNINRNRASNKIGIRLSTAQYSAGSPEPIANNAQVFTDSVITDTLNWTRIAGSFISDSSYAYLSIGNFFDDSLTTYVKFDTTHLQSYYYVDDIILSPDSNCCSGIDEILESEKIKIYPNPAHDWMQVETKELSKVSVYNILGKFCMSDALHSSYHKLDVSVLNKGLYFLFLQTSTKSIIRKLIIE